MKKVLIIGAGASGIMAAIWAARNGASVTVLEQAEKPLKKLHRTGNGRCNLTNLKTDSFSYRGSDPAKRDRILARFTPEDVLLFFRTLGLETKSRDGWMYPLNDSAASVARILLYEAQDLGVKVKTRQCVKDLIRLEDGTFCVMTEDWKYQADAVIAAVGTPAGGAGDACSIAAKCADSFSLERSPLLPALTALYVREAPSLRWAGVRCEAGIRLFVSGRETAAAAGELQLTEKGVSGIPAFQISRYASDALSRGDNTALLVDFMPHYTEIDLREMLERIHRKAPGKSWKMVLTGLLAEKLAELFAGLFRDDPGSIPGKLKAFPLTVCGTGPVENAQICMGGISLASLTDDLEACSVPGLFFAGEALDVDGTCGGYNLQWAWSSGRAAGCRAAAAKSILNNGAVYA